MTRIVCGVILGGVVVAALHAQVPQGQARPTFQSSIEYVEVAARVLDGRGAAVKDLTKERFQVFEDGVPQDIATFSMVDLPVAPARATTPALSGGAFATSRPDVTSSVREKADERIYVILIDDLSISPIRTPYARQLMRDFIERGVGPADLVAVMNTGKSNTFQNFTSNKELLLAAVSRFVGEKGLSPTVSTLTSIQYRSAADASKAGPEDSASASPIAPSVNGQATDSHTNGSQASPSVSAQALDSGARGAQVALLRIVAGMAGMPGASKAVILLSEGVQFDSLTNTEGVNIFNAWGDSGELAAKANIPIYPIDPRGMTTLADESILVNGINPGDSPLAPLRAELLRSQRQLRGLAEDTGGFALTGSDDFAGAFDRIVRQTSSYYLLGYYPKNDRRDGKFRKIEVRINDSSLRVVARRGYTAASGRLAKRPGSPGPSGTSEQLRQMLNSPLPVSGLGLMATAAAFKDGDHGASVAVAVEMSGEDLTLTERAGVFTGRLDVLAAALEQRGAVRASDAKALQLGFQRDLFLRVRQRGFRWLSRLRVKPGNYQLRFAAASDATHQGSAWYDLLVPDFSSGKLAMSDLLLSSRASFETPTYKPDLQLQDALPGPPTTLRDFPIGDEIVVFGEIYDNRVSEPHAVDVSVAVIDEARQALFHRTEALSLDGLRKARGTYRSSTPISLQGFKPGSYILTVAATRTDDPSVSANRSIPFRVVSASR